MVPKPLRYLLLACGFVASQNLWASEARVNAAGGLSLVIQDEAYDVNPFVVGNPAGLALIPPKSRLDLSGNYFFENETQDQFQRTYTGSVGDLANNTVKYKGLLFFPTDRWGVQLNGDYLYTEGQAQSGLNSQGNNRLRGLFRTAYDFGPFVLGADFSPTQTTSPLVGQVSPAGAITSGTDTGTALSVNGGLLACFPSDPGPKQDRFEIGGVYGNQLAPPREELDLNVLPSGSATPAPVTATFTDTNAQVIGPEAYFESPGSLQMAVISRFAQFSANFQDNSPNTLLVPVPMNFKFDDGSDTALVGVFKSSSPLLKGVNLKLGGLFSYASFNENFYNSAGNAVTATTQQNLQAQIGVGVEKPGDFTVGLQAALQSVAGANHNASGNDIGDTGFLDYSVALGGERWISKHWALRMGLAYQSQFNGGNLPYATFFLPAMDPGVRLINTTITAGVGFKDGGIYADWGFSYGEPTRDGGGPSAFATQLGTQLATGILFN